MKMLVGFLLQLYTVSRLLAFWHTTKHNFQIYIHECFIFFGQPTTPYVDDNIYEWPFLFCNIPDCSYPLPPGYNCITPRLAGIQWYCYPHCSGNKNTERHDLPPTISMQYMYIYIYIDGKGKLKTSINIHIYFIVAAYLGQFKSHYQLTCMIT